MSTRGLPKLEKEVRGMLLVQTAFPLLGEIFTLVTSCRVLISDL